METTQEILDWLEQIAPGQSLSAIAATIGVPQRTFNYHVNTGELTAEEVIKIARAYEMSPIYALVDFGFITEDELAYMAASALAEELPIRMLLDTALRRLDKLADDGKRLSTDPYEALVMLSAMYRTYMGATGPLKFAVGPESVSWDYSDNVTQATAERPADAQVKATNRVIDTVQMALAAKKPNRRGQTMEDEKDQTYNS